MKGFPIIFLNISLCIGQTYEESIRRKEHLLQKRLKITQRARDPPIQCLDSISRDKRCYIPNQITPCCVEYQPIDRFPEFLREYKCKDHEKLAYKG